jgi:hypothetical protein
VTCLEVGDRWVHLRQCMTCGITLCCDDSPSRHMSKHCRALGHPIMRSAEPDEDWVYCSSDAANIRATPDGWQTYDVKAEIGIFVAGEVIAAGGTLDVAPGHVTDEGFPLGAWMRYVRRLHASGDLDPADAAAIEALPGWTWQGAG